MLAIHAGLVSSVLAQAGSAVRIGKTLGGIIVLCYILHSVIASPANFSSPTSLYDVRSEAVRREGWPLPLLVPTARSSLHYSILFPLALYFCYPLHSLLPRNRRPSVLPRRGPSGPCVGLGPLFRNSQGMRWLKEFGRRMALHFFYSHYYAMPIATPDTTQPSMPDISVHRCSGIIGRNELQESARHSLVTTLPSPTQSMMCQPITNYSTRDSCTRLRANTQHWTKPFSAPLSIAFPGLPFSSTSVWCTREAKSEEGGVCVTSVAPRITP